MQIFLDTEFTGLNQNTTLISIAMFIDDNNYFYAELNDFDKSQIFSWLTENVISKLEFYDKISFFNQVGNSVKMKSDSSEVKEILSNWLKQYDVVEIWADVLAYDWVLFCNLFGGALNLPKNVFYIPFDLSTLFRTKGFINPKNNYEKDIDRFQFVGVANSNQHNALIDTIVEKKCYEKLMSL